MNRNGQTKVVDVIIFIVILGIVAAIGYAIYNINKPSITGNVINTGENSLKIDDSAKKNCKYVQVPYNNVEYYTDKEPYEYEETYYEKVPYTDKECTSVNMIYKIDWIKNNPICVQEECARYNNVCVEKNFWGNCIRYEQQCAENKCVKYKVECGIKVTNNERENLNLNLELSKWNGDNQQKTVMENREVVVSALQTTEITWTYSKLNTESTSCIYTPINAPQRQECRDVIKSKDEPRTRTVTKYREVSKTRTVTKYKEEYKCD